MRRIIGGIVGSGIAIFAGAGAMDDDTKRDEAGAIVESGGLGVLAIQVGDCIQMPEGFEVMSVEGVPCTEPHGGQVYAEYELELDGPFPGQAAVDEQALWGCKARWTEAVGTVYEDDLGRDFSFFNPIEEGWAAGDRGVQCILVSVDGSMLVGDQLP